MQKPILKKLVIGILLSLSATCLAAPPQQVQINGTVKANVTNFSDDSKSFNKVLSDWSANEFQAILSFLFYFPNSGSFGTLDDLLKNPDAIKKYFSELQKNFVIPTWKTLPTAQVRFDQNIPSTTDAAVNLALTDTTTKDNDILNLLFQGMPSANDSKQKDIYSINKSIYQYPTTDSTTQASLNIQTNKALNANNLLYRQYDSTLQQPTAMQYIRYLSNLAALPEIFELNDSNKNKDTLDIPYNPTSMQGTYPVKWDEVKFYCSENKKCTASDIKNTLETEPMFPYYRQYILNYRTLLAARSLFLNNILDIYQKKLSTVDTSGKQIGSLDQIEYNEATRRTTTAYQDAINKAPPIEVEREMVLTLAEIRRELYEIRQNQERQLLTQSVLGLQNIAQNKSQFQVASRQIGKMVYCLTYGLKDVSGNVIHDVKKCAEEVKNNPN